MGRLPLPGLEACRLHGLRLRPINVQFLGGAVVVLALIGGCDPTVDSFQENELHYSIFGYLNASADTQFVRVEPLRDGMLTRAPATLDADVALINRSTGRTVPLQDSLFRYPGDRTTHNVFTTADIQPTAQYRLVVEGPNGATSRAQTSVPDSFPAPVVRVPASEPDCSLYGRDLALLEVKGIDRLVAVTARYHTGRREEPWRVHYLADTSNTPDGTVISRIHYDDDYCQIGGGRGEGGTVTRIDVVVAAGAPDWPEFLRLDWETETLPTTASNVKGGVGLLGGVVTDTVVLYPQSEEE